MRRSRRRSTGSLIRNTTWCRCKAPVGVNHEPRSERTGWIQISEQARVLAQLRKVLKTSRAEALHGLPISLTREDLLRQGLTEAAIDKIGRLLSYFSNSSSGGARDVLYSIETAEAAAVQQFADIVAKQKHG